MTIQTPRLPQTSAPSPRNLSLPVSLVSQALKGMDGLDRSGPEPKLIPKPNPQPAKYQVDSQKLRKSLTRMAKGALVGALTLGASVPICGMAMSFAHTEGQENRIFALGGLALGVSAGLTAAACGASVVASMAVGGALAQSVMSLADWFGK